MSEEITQHKSCPNCGRELEYDPAKKALACPYCGEHAEEKAPAEKNIVTELDFIQAILQQQGEDTAQEQIVVTCANCAAVVTLPPNTASGRCVYCDSPLVASGQVMKFIRPAGILPFAITSDEAKNHYKNWLNSRWFMPNAIKKEARLDALQGVYIPYWTYDCTTTAKYIGYRGDYYYVTVSYTAVENGKSVRKTRQERRTSWTFVTGTVHNAFDDILIPGSKSLPADLMNAIGPWGLASMKGYNADFIRGFREEIYTIDLTEGFVRAKRQMTPVVDRTVRQHIGGDEQRVTSTSIKYDDITYKHVLLPIWVSSFHFRKKVYQIVINARNGKVAGHRPWSIWKILFAILLTFIIIIGLLALLNKAA